MLSWRNCISAVYCQVAGCSVDTGLYLFCQVRLARPICHCNARTPLLTDHFLFGRHAEIDDHYATQHKTQHPAQLGMPCHPYKTLMHAPAVSALLQPRLTCPWAVRARMEAWRAPTSGLRMQGLHSSNSSRHTVHRM
jgi:hypothetical protein